MSSVPYIIHYVEGHLQKCQVWLTHVSASFFEVQPTSLSQSLFIKGAGGGTLGSDHGK